MNDSNLRVPTSEEARKNGKKGGIASGISRKRKKLLKEAFDALMDANIENIEGLTDVRGLEIMKGKDLTATEGLCLAMLIRGLRGDVKAAQFIARMTEQLPPERIDFYAPDPEVIANVESILLQGVHPNDEDKTDL